MNKTRVMLISPGKGLAAGRPQRPRFHVHPLGLLYIAGMLESKGYECAICDAYSFGYSMGQIFKHIRSFKPDVVGLTAMTIISRDAYTIAREIKKANPSIVTVMGGPHATALPEEALRDGHMNVAVLGEGEYAMLDVCRVIERGKRKFDSVKGVCYRDGRDVKITQAREHSLDIDSLPYPAYRILPRMNEYNPPPHWGKKGRFASLITSRGCPHGCIFCSVTRAWGRRYRYRSPGNVLNELKLLAGKYGINYISFRDSTFTLYRKRVIDICKGMAAGGPAIRWNCNAHADEVDEELLGWMKKGGCESIHYGIECGNREMLRRFKGIDRDTVKRAISLTDNAGIKAHGYFIFGLPGENSDTIRETIDFAKSLPLYSAGFTTATPFPGSELWDYSVKNDLILTRDWSKYDLKDIPVSRYSDLTPAEILRSQKKAFREFYLRPKIVLHHISKIKGINDFFNYIGEALINLR